MTNFNHEGNFEGDSEDRGNTYWRELDWKQFLTRREKETARFLMHYDNCPVGATERLDWVALQMEWEADDWAVGDGVEDDESASEDRQWQEADEDASQDEDPYTIHRHPVYIVCSGLFLQLRFTWRRVMREKRQVDGLLSWDFADCLNEAEKHSLLGMQCMDMADYMLCVVHFKRALRGINAAMSLLPKLILDVSGTKELESCCLMRLFDLREVCLRVIQDCRDEDKRDFGD
jgi:hypothetical protein